MRSDTTADGPGPVTFVFLLGTGRCGSSLVQELLSHHPEVGFLSNFDDRFGSTAISRWNANVYRQVPLAFTKKGRARFAPSEGYRILDREVSPAISTPMRDLVAADATPWLGGRFRRFFEERAARQGRPVFLHKFTGWPRAGFIDAALPAPRFVHVIRDGRAVANSLVQVPWWRGFGGPQAWGLGPLPEDLREEWEASGRSFPVLAALEWKLLMEAFDEASQAIPADRWFQLRYEDLVEDPRGSTQGLLAFMGLSWTDSFEHAFRRYGFRADRRDAFRRDLRPDDVRAIESTISVELRRLGYEPSA
jgi:Sulfotransferase family